MASFVGQKVLHKNTLKKSFLKCILKRIQCLIEVKLISQPHNNTIENNQEFPIFDNQINKMNKKKFHETLDLIET